MKCIYSCLFFSSFKFPFGSVTQYGGGEGPVLGFLSLLYRGSRNKFEVIQGLWKCKACRFVEKLDMKDQSLKL